MDRSKREQTLNKNSFEEQTFDKNSVVFMGSPLRFSPRLLDTFRSEFRWLDFKVVSDLESLNRSENPDSIIAMLVIDEDGFDSLIQDSAAFFEAVGQGKIVAAYHDPSVACKIITARKSCEKLAEVGFLPLNVQVDVWLSVMNLLICGEVFYPSELINETAKPHRKEMSKSLDAFNLTPREWEVLKLVAVGQQNKNIASDLGLSQHTIKLHIHNILKKIGVTNRTCAASWYTTSALRRKGGHANFVSGLSDLKG